MHDRWLTVLLAAVVVTRIPFLWMGYGADQDAWRVAHVSGVLWQTGEYQPSRLPGYPLHEVLSAPFVGIGHSPLSNSATLVVTLVLLVIWTGIVRTEARHPALLAVCLAFTPLLWINSACTMDYLWSTLFLLLAYQASMGGYAVRAGIMVGIAAGFRPANGIAAIPILITLLLDRRAAGDLVRFAVAFLVSAVAACAPLLLKYGLAGWIAATQAGTSGIQFTFAGRLAFFTYRSIYSVGPLALIAAAAAIGFAKMRSLSPLPEDRKHLLVWSAWLVTFLLLFLAVPLERAYLLPAIPFLYLLLDRISTRGTVVVFTIAVVSFGFVNVDVIEHRGVVGTPGLNVHWGMVVEDYQRRERMLQDRTEIAHVSVADSAVVMTGTDAAFWFENPLVEDESDLFWSRLSEHSVRRKGNPEIHFTPLLLKNELDTVRNAGFTVYCLETAREYLERVTGYSATAEGVFLIDHLSRRRSSPSLK